MNAKRVGWCSVVSGSVFLAWWLACFGGATRTGLSAVGNAAQTDEPSGVADVRSFGARGDGVTDDTEALQRAIDSGLAVVRFPKGVYRITRPLVVDLSKIGYTALRGDGVARLVMAGPGPAIRVVGTHFSSADPERFQARVWLKERMPLIDGLAIEGANEKAVGIEAVGTMQLTISRVHLRRLLHGVHLVQNNRNIVIANSHIYHNRGVGIFYDDVNLHQSNIVGCHISYNGGGGIVCRAGNVRNIHVSGCDLESNMDPDQPPTANILIDCRGSKHGTGEVAITGCTIQHNSRSPNSANIRIIGRSEPTEKRKLVREGNVTITGNVLSDVQTNIHLKDCRGVTVVGNTFWMGYQHDLLVEDSSNVVVGPNNFDRNPRYDYGNALDANDALVFRNCQDCTLTGLHINSVWRSPAGLLIENCRRFNVTACTVLDCDHVGIWLKNVRDSRLSDCLIRDDRKGSSSVPLRVTGGRGNLIVDNLFDRAPQIDSTDAHVVRGNHWPRTDGSASSGRP